MFREIKRPYVPIEVIRNKKEEEDDEIKLRTCTLTIYLFYLSNSNVSKCRLKDQAKCSAFLQISVDIGDINLTCKFQSPKLIR